MNWRRLWPLRLYRVVGPSMLPTYQPGQVLVGWCWVRPQAGRVVVAWQDGRVVVKRLARLEGKDLWLVGDNTAVSVDSRRWGAVPRSRFEGIIIGRLA
jgi:phage repressor protein C with HTH and peptisase S24 domain